MISLCYSWQNYKLRNRFLFAKRADSPPYSKLENRNLKSKIDQFLDTFLSLLGKKNFLRKNKMRMHGKSSFSSNNCQTQNLSDKKTIQWTFSVIFSQTHMIFSMVSFCYCRKTPFLCPVRKICLICTECGSSISRDSCLFFWTHASGCRYWYRGG